MKSNSYRKILMTIGGVLIATLAVGCYGGGSGYSSYPNGYNSSYGSSYPDRNYNNGYASQRSDSNSYNAGYQNGVAADANRDHHEVRVDQQHAVVHTEPAHPTVDHDKVSLKDSYPANRADKN